MTRFSRLLLYRIALGAPVVVASSTGCAVSSTGANCPRGTGVDHVITADQHSMLVVDGIISQMACDDLCRSFDDPSRLDGAAPPDAGVAFQITGARISCDLDRIADQEILTCTYAFPCRGGRAPAGLIEPAVSSATAIGAWLAQSAHLEAASVDAFVDLARELGSLGAPASLVSAARRAANDERRHAESVSALASRFGTERPPVRRTETAARTLFELAADNAVEGCVREAHAALVAAHQAIASSDADVRATYRIIARDEARHALLSFAIDDWARERLDPGSMRTVDARRLAFQGEVRSAFVDPTDDERDVLGLPSAARSHELLAMLG